MIIFTTAPKGGSVTRKSMLEQAPRHQENPGEMMSKKLPSLVP
jgi:hypothetical protein